MHSSLKETILYLASHEVLGMAAIAHGSCIPPSLSVHASLPMPCDKYMNSCFNRHNHNKSHQKSRCAGTNLAVKGMIGNFWLISLKINLDAFIFK